MGFEATDFKPFIRLASAVVGLALLALSIAGFDHLSKTNGALEGQASFGCMCFLGVVFGLLLFCGESKSELFFFFFGFMRYRIGRAVVFIVAGIMIAIIGKNMNDACRCKSYLILIIEGVACLACAVLQIIGLFSFGNNTTKLSSKSARPPPAPSAPAPPAAPAESSYVPPEPSKTPAAKKSTRDTSNFDSVAPAQEDNNSHLPAWMRA